VAAMKGHHMSKLTSRALLGLAVITLTAPAVPAFAASSGTSRAGQFCKTADRGKTRVASNGRVVRCVYYQGHYHWRYA
jgi:hypothetical protein